MTFLSSSNPLSSIYDGQSEVWIDQGEPKPTSDGLIAPCLGKQLFGKAFIKRLYVAPKYGSGYRDFLAFSKDLYAVYGNFKFNQDFFGHITGGNFLKFHFKLSGKNTLVYDSIDEYFLRGGRTAVIQQPEDVVKKDCHSRDTIERSLTLFFPPRLITDMLGVEPDQLPQSIRSFITGDGDYDFFYQEMALVEKMTRCIFDLVNPTYCHELRHMHTQARLLDLLCMMLDGLISQGQPPEIELRLNRRDIDILYQAKELLDLQSSTPVSIEQLAKDIGVNRTKLMKGFKGIFGETIFEYQHRVRMEEAHRLLLEGAGNVTRIAESVGYSHQSTFTNAFKAYYGFSPKELKNKKTLFSK